MSNAMPICELRVKTAPKGQVVSRAPTPNMIKYVSSFNYRVLRQRNDVTGIDYLVCATNCSFADHLFDEIKEAIYKTKMKSSQLSFQDHQIHFVEQNKIIIFCNSKIALVWADLVKSGESDIATVSEAQE